MTIFGTAHSFNEFFKINLVEITFFNSNSCNTYRLSFLAGDPWDVSEMKSSLQKEDKKKTPEEFLGANANLVNLNDLVTAKPPPSSE